MRISPLANYDYRSAWRIATTGGEFVLKRDSRPGVARREAGMQQHVARLGIPAASVTGVEDDTPGEAFAMRWVQGRPLHKRATPESFRAVGEALGRLHVLPAPADTPRMPATFGLEAAITPHLEYLLDRARLTTEAAAQVLAFARAHEADTTPGALLHGDCQPAHFLLEGDFLTAVIDWCDAATGDPVADFGVLLLGHWNHLDDVLANYGVSRAEEQRIRLMLPYFMALRGAAAAEWLDTHGYPGTWPEECVNVAAGLMRA